MNKNFIRENENYYYSGIYETNFSEKTVQHINQWVEQNTDGMIKNIISEIPESAMMYLINALAFDAKWQMPYQEYNIRKDIFTKENGETQEVSFMHSTEGELLEDENTIGFVKPYKDGKYEFVALLPKEERSIEQYISTLSAEKITNLLTNKKSVTVNASLPKFKNECTFDMIGILEKMGVKEAFDVEKADLSEIGSYDNLNLYIDSVTHKTYISVAEQGTKAGAVTAIEVGAERAVKERKQVRLNRPFVYIIIDCEEQLPLFMGVVTEIE